jgi:hypothetical protein
VTSCKHFVYSALRRAAIPFRRGEKGHCIPSLYPPAKHGCC